MTIALLYHDVVAGVDYATSGFGGADANIYKLERTEFEEHLGVIEKSVGRTGVRITDTQGAAFPIGVALTFDDGGASGMWIADAVERRGWRGFFFITTNYIGTPGFLSAAQIRELDQRGHVVGSHSCSHPARMSHCDPAQLEAEWSGSVARLSELLGRDCRVASVPGGYYSRRVAATAAAAGVRLLFNSEPVTSVEQVDGCSVVGRFSVQQGVASSTVARLANGDWSPRAKQYVLWNGKKVAKSVFGNLYIRARKALLRRGGS